MLAQYKKEGSEEKVTLLIYGGKDGDASYSKEQLESFQKQADKAGVNLKVVGSADDVVDYVNDKNGNSDPRSEDLVSNLDYFGHATPGSLEIGWVDHGVIKSHTNEWLDVDDFKKDAFSSNSNSDLVGGCRTAVAGVLRDAVTTKMAAKVGGEVKGSDVRVYYPGGVVSDKQLVQYNKGHIVIVQGTGGVSKQSLEPKKKN